MSAKSLESRRCHFARTVRRATVLAIAVSLGGCAQLGSLTSQEEQRPTTFLAGHGGDAKAPQTELQRAVEHWRKEYEKDPRSVEKAVNYVKNLKAMGQNDRAFQVLQEAVLFNSSDRRIASEYGRLALEHNQFSAAQKMLEIADDPAAPDWRVISARGTVLAKQGKYKDAIPFYERALKVAPEQASVMNNLALALTMSGEAAKGEELLRRAAEKEESPRVRQNLAIVLGAQGKHDEAQSIVASSPGDDALAQNTEVLRQVVKAQPRQAPVTRAVASGAASDAWSTKVMAPSRASGTQMATAHAPAVQATAAEGVRTIAVKSTPAASSSGIDFRPTQQ